MKQTILFCCALLLLTTSCQTEKTAFRFRATSPIAEHAIRPAELPVAAAPTATVAPTVLSVPAGPIMARRRVPNRFRAVQQLAPSTFKSASAATSYFKSITITKRHRPQKPQLEHTAAFILGVALVAGGIASGILLGGWLGLGVGALVVLLGYYFLGVGIGGKHAWLEIFQEFFNM